MYPEPSRTETGAGIMTEDMDALTANLADIQEWLKILLGSVFLLGFLLGGFLSGKTVKFRVLVPSPLCVMFLLWYFST